MELLLIILWWLCGVCGFAFWWTRDAALTSDDVYVAVCVGIAGPMTWVMGAAIYLDNKRQRRRVNKMLV